MTNSRHDRSRHGRRCSPAVHLAIWTLVAALSACDTTPAPTEDRLVVEAWFDAGSPLPPVRVTETVPASMSTGSPGVDDASVTVRLDGSEYVYRRNPERFDQFIPAEEHAGVVVQTGSGFRVTVTSDGRTATAVGGVPRRLNLTALEIDVPDEPVSAVFVDTLDIGLDSLNLAIDARQGYIYPISVSAQWEPADGPSGEPAATPSEQDSYWIQARLLPRNPFSSTLIDFFLLPEQIFQENTAPLVDGPVLNSRRRSWSGVYAVPVDGAEDPVPEHVLRVAVLRSSAEFARFATSKSDPQRREPVSNVAGGLGFVAGVSVDSVSVIVNQD